MAKEIKRWITVNGAHVPIYKDDNMIKALHFTSLSNAKSILSDDFDLDRSGEQSPMKRKFSTYGKAIYFSTEDLENNFYAERAANTTAIQADIDTSKMVEINLGDRPVKSYSELYERIISQLPADIQKEYADYIKAHKSEQISETYISNDALSVILPRYYTGLVIKQKHSRENFDYISGGNQIVVYDTSVIRNKKIRS